MIDFSDLIGKPFQYNGRGPDVYDCYGIVLECMRRSGVDKLPQDFVSPSDREGIASMVRTQVPQYWRKQREEEIGEGSVLLIRTLGKSTHCAYHLGGNYFIHAWEGSESVVRERISLWRHRIEGYYAYRK